MPARMQKACRVMGCGAPDPCPQHGRFARERKWDQARGTASSRGYGHQWAQYTDRFFAELWTLKVPRAGLCGCRHPSTPMTTDSECARDGRIVLATLVDHIVPVQGKDDPRFFDRTNHQGLCASCHAKKRRRERR